MSDDTPGQRASGEPPLKEDDVGASIHDTGGGEIGTIEDFDEDHVYVDPSDDFDDEEKLDALGWRATDGSFEISTDAIQGLPDEAEGDHGVDLSGYERPDDGPGSADRAD